MRNLIVLIIIMALAGSVGAKAKPNKCRVGPIRIGVIDTGFGYGGLGHDAKLCKYGHKDFTVDKKFDSTFDTKVPVPSDLHSHGTNVVGLIEEYANKGKNPYCLVIIKYFSKKQGSFDNLINSADAFAYANNLNLDIINYSGGGEAFDVNEKQAVTSFLNSGGILVAAAGNESKSLNWIDNFYFPAMYDSRIKVVGNIDGQGNRVNSSNYGPLVTTWENGHNRTAYGITLTGTSQATAVVTGKTVASMKSCDR